MESIKIWIDRTLIINSFSSNLLEMSGGNRFRQQQNDRDREVKIDLGKGKLILLGNQIQQPADKPIRNLNSFNIPRDINTTTRKPMDKQNKYRQIFKKAAPKLYFPKSRISDPLFLFKLHSQLSALPEHLQLYCELTQQALKYIGKNVRKNDQMPQQIWRQQRPFIRKFEAFRKLLSYLRLNRVPQRQTLQGIIKCGIYGMIKNKYTKKISDIVEKYLRKYSRKQIKAHG